MGRLEEARLYAEDCLKAGDLSWMLNYGIDPVRYRRDIRDILYKTYSGLVKTEKLTPYRKPGEKIRSLLRFFSYGFKAAVNRRLYQKHSLSAGDAYGTEVYEGSGPHLDSYIQYYNAFEGYPRRAITYLDKARDFETALIPEIKPTYDLEEGTLLKRETLILSALEGFNPAWEQEQISKCYAELSKRGKGGAGKDAAERLYALNRGALRQRGIRLPVELNIRFEGAPAGTKNTARTAGALVRALKKAGFDAAAGSGFSPRFALTITLDATGLTGHVELYDRQRGNAVLRRTFPIAALSPAGLHGFVRALADAAFTAE
jgi:hypothetical protein